MAQKSKKTVARAGSLSKIVAKKAKNGKIWVIAVDPFSEVDLTPTWNLVAPLAEHAGARLEAVYVLAPASMNWTGDFSGPWMKKFEPIAREKMDTILPGVEKSVLLCKGSGQRAAVKTLIQYAQKKKADSIVILTHGRSGLERVALGSFAETVILTSHIPVLVLNPSHKMPQTVKKILVPTDLTKKSEKFVNDLAIYAKALGAEVVLYHKQPDPLDPIIQQGVYTLGGGWVSVQSFVDSELEDKNKRIAKIEADLRKRGVQVSHVVDFESGSLVDSINRVAADQNADMVSVLTHAGPWSAALLGSVARGLVRNADVPVLVRR